MRTAPSALPAPESCLTLKFGERVPVHRLRINLAAVRVQHTHAHTADVAGIAAHPGHDVRLHNPERHRPGRVEVHGVDRGGQRRRLAADLSDHDHVALLDHVAIDGFGNRRRDIHHDIPLAKREIQFADAVHRRRELLHPFLHRNVERGERLRSDGAGLGQAVARLEALHRGFKRRIENFDRGLIRGEVVRHRQPLTQQQHVAPACAWRKLRCLGQRRPAATQVDGGVAQERRGGALISVAVEGRQRRLGDRGNALGLHRRLGCGLGGRDLGLGNRHGALRSRRPNESY